MIYTNLRTVKVKINVLYLTRLEDKGSLFWHCLFTSSKQTHCVQWWYSSVSDTLWFERWKDMVSV